MYIKLVMVLLLFCLFFPSIFNEFLRERGFVPNSPHSRGPHERYDRSIIIIVVVILYVCSIIVKKYYEEILEINVNTNGGSYGQDFGGIRRQTLVGGGQRRFRTREGRTTLYRERNGFHVLFQNARAQNYQNTGHREARSQSRFNVLMETRRQNSGVNNYWAHSITT